MRVLLWPVCMQVVYHGSGPNASTSTPMHGAVRCCHQAWHGRGQQASNRAVNDRTCFIFPPSCVLLPPGFLWPHGRPVPCWPCVWRCALHAWGWINLRAGPLGMRPYGLTHALTQCVCFTLPGPSLPPAPDRKQRRRTGRAGRASPRLGACSCEHGNEGRALRAHHACSVQC